MSLFKVLRGNSSRIGTETTPFHDGYAYFTTDDGGFYIDATVGADNRRIRVNPKGILAEEKGAPEGVAELNENSQVVMSQLPIYVQSEEPTDAPNGAFWVVATPPPMPVKGDLISLDLGAPTPVTGFTNAYRILNVNGTVAEVMAMFDAAQIAFDTGSTNTYADKTLDTYLNNTWYNSLSATAKAAIVDKNITQYQYTSSWDVFDSNTHASWADYSTKTVKDVVGERHVYAIDIEDVEKYFGGTDTESSTFSDTEVFIFFCYTASSSEVTTMPWLRSASAESGKAFFANNGWGRILSANTNANTEGARPAFQIDLSKIDWTLYTA